VIEGSQKMRSAEQGNSSRLGSYLTLAGVLLRAQSRQVVSQLVVNAAADLCPHLLFSLLYQLDDVGSSFITAQMGGILLPSAETTHQWERLINLLPPDTDRFSSVFEQIAPPEVEAELSLHRLYFAPAQTPTQFYGWLVAGAVESFEEEELYYLRSLAQLAAIALENASRFEALKESAAETTLINEVAGSLATSLNAEELFFTFMAYLRNLLPIERATIAILSPNWTHYELPYNWVDPPGRVRRGYIKNLPLLNSVLERSIREREIIIDALAPNEGTEDPFFKPLDGSRLIVPLLAKGRPIGALQMAHRQHGCYRENDTRLTLVEKLVSLFALALVNSRLYEEKQLSAEFDNRVGVYNHDYFDRELSVQLEKARRLGYKLGLVMIDMDNLKKINDAYGHLAGDAALRHIAGQVSSIVRATDVVARYGGDEFGVMLPGCTARSLEIVAEKARRNIRSAPLELENDVRAQLTVSVGAALFPDDADTPLELIQRADAAMYIAKQHRDATRIGRRARVARVSDRELERGTPDKPLADLAQTTQADSIDITGLNVVHWGTADYERFLNWLGNDRPGSGVATKVLRETYNQLSETRQQLYKAESRQAQLEDALRNGLRMVAFAVEQREPYLLGSTERLHQLALLLAKELHCSPEQCLELETASWLANLGRLAVPEYIWTKTSHLSTYDWRRVQQAPLEAIRLAEYWKPLATPGVLLAIRHQRERFDGLGYPTGLAGEEIPLLARILGLAGAVVALHQPRPFRAGLNLTSIRSEIEQATGRHFDPTLARIMLNFIDTGKLDFLD